MNLELTHISPYLPYELKVKDIDDETTKQLVGIENKSYYFNNGLNDKGRFKPILRPMSDITKSIEVDGVTFIPSHKLFLKSRGIDFVKTHGALKYLTYHKVEKLIKWHFDVFGLIDKGLAVSIHDVTQADT